MIKAALRSALLMRITASATALTIWSLSSHGKDPAIPAADQSSMNVDSRLEKYTDTSLIGNATNAAQPRLSAAFKQIGPMPMRCSPSWTAVNSADRSQ